MDIMQTIEDDNIGKLSYVFQNTLNSKQKKKCHRNFFFVAVKFSG